MNRTIILAGPNREGKFIVVETTNYLYRKPGERLTEAQATELADSEYVDAKFIPMKDYSGADFTVGHYYPTRPELHIVK